jgi:hypothetical protein
MMPNKIIKAYPVQVKQVDGKNRTLSFTASTEGVDRDGEVLSANGWMFDNFMKNPVFLWAHQYTQPPIGKVVQCGIVTNSVTAEVEFADAETYQFADIVYRLYLGGFLNAVSVGFIPIEWETGKKDGQPKKTYTKQEMLEISAVPVPSNPDALQQARTAKLITLKELRLVKKALDAPQSKSTAVEEPKPSKSSHSQEELADEIDYLKNLLQEVGLSERSKLLAKELGDTISRLTGGDTPENIKGLSMAKRLCKEALEEADTYIEEMHAHHKAHNTAYDKGCKALANVHYKLVKMFDEEPEDEPEEPETPETPEPEEPEDEAIRLISTILGK